MCIAILLGIVSMNLVYQKEWRLMFGRQHLDLAQAASNAETQYQEISQAIRCMETFPKEGNWDFWNKLNPKTNLAKAWTALYEVQAYADSVQKLPENDSAYHIGVYNTQEKIQYFENEYLGGFSAYLDWGAGRYIGNIIGGTFAVIWGICWAITSYWASEDSGLEALAWILTSLPIWIAVIFFLWVGVSPVFYSGPI